MYDITYHDCLSKKLEYSKEHLNELWNQLTENWIYVWKIENMSFN